VCLVPALSPNFDIGSCTFFCLALISALCKTFGFGHSVNSHLKNKNQNQRCATWVNHDTPCGTLKDKKINFFNYYFIHYFFLLKISLVPALKKCS